MKGFIVFISLLAFSNVLAEEFVEGDANEDAYYQDPPVNPDFLRRLRLELDQLINPVTETFDETTIDGDFGKPEPFIWNALQKQISNRISGIQSSLQSFSQKIREIPESIVSQLIEREEKAINQLDVLINDSEKLRQIAGNLLQSHKNEIDSFKNKASKLRLELNQLKNANSVTAIYDETTIDGDFGKPEPFWWVVFQKQFSNRISSIQSSLQSIGQKIKETPVKIVSQLFEKESKAIQQLETLIKEIVDSEKLKEIAGNFLQSHKTEIDSLKNKALKLRSELNQLRNRIDTATAVYDETTIDGDFGKPEPFQWSVIQNQISNKLSSIRSSLQLIGQKIKDHPESKLFESLQIKKEELAVEEVEFVIDELMKHFGQFNQVQGHFLRDSKTAARVLLNTLNELKLKIKSF